MWRSNRALAGGVDACPPRMGAVHPPRQPSVWGDRPAADLLGAVQRHLGPVVPHGRRQRFRPRKKPPFLMRRIFSRHAGVDRAVHGDLHHDFDHRRSPRRIFAIGAGRADSALVDGGRQSAGRIADCSGACRGVFAVGFHARCVADGSHIPLGCDLFIHRRRGAYVAGRGDCLEDAIHAGISRHHDDGPAADVAVVGSIRAAGKQLVRLGYPA